MSEEKAEKKVMEPRRAVALLAKKAPAAKPMRRAAMPKKVSPRTVKGKIAAIQKTAGMIYSGARSIQSDAKNQMKENQEAVANIYAGVRSIQSAILEQMKENQAYVKDFFG